MIYLSFFSLFISSCGDSFFENGTEPGDYIPDDLWIKPEMVKATMADLYAKLELEDFYYTTSDIDPKKNRIDEYKGHYVIDSHITLSTASDETWPSWNNGQLGDPSKIQKVYEDYWFYTYGNVYTQIRSCNKYLKQIDEAQITDDEKQSYKDEIRFIRAFHYFQLVKRFGGVPLVLDVPEPSDEIEKLQVSRNQEQEIWDFIDDELTDIALSLPESRASSEKNRANRYMAYALQSRAMLYAASIAKYGHVDEAHYVGIKDNPRIYYSKAIDAAQKVIDSNIYEIYGLNGSDEPEKRTENYYNLFLDKNNKEYIMCRDYTVLGIGKYHLFDFYTTPFSFATGGYGCGMTPTLELVEAYEYIDGSKGTLKTINEDGDYIKYNHPLDLFKNKDPRLAASVYLPMFEFKDSFIEIRGGVAKNGNVPERKNWPINRANLSQKEKFENGLEINKGGKDGIVDSDDPTSTGFYQRKFYDESQTDLAEVTSRSDTPWPVFRLAEMYLNIAEAEMELGHRAYALSALNVVRKRAGIKQLKFSEMNLEKVRNERRIELAFEGHRFWDLRRWRIAATPRADNGGRGVLDGLLATALYPWAVYEDNGYLDEKTGLVIANSYIFSKEKEEVRKPAKVFLPRHYYIKFKADDINSNPKLVQNPGY